MINKLIGFWRFILGFLTIDTYGIYCNGERCSGSGKWTYNEAQSLVLLQQLVDAEECSNCNVDPMRTKVEVGWVGFFRK